MKKLTPLFIFLSIIAKSQCPLDSTLSLNFPYSVGSSCTALVQATAYEKAAAYFTRAICIKKGLAYSLTDCASNTDSVLAYNFPYVPGTSCSLLQSATVGERAEVFFLRQLLGVSGSGGGSGWLLTGNSGTTPGTNFLGTTDDKSFWFKTNNTVSGWLDPDNLNTFLGFQAGAVLTYTTVTGSQNTAIGGGSMTSLTSGTSNTALGVASAASLTTGTYNTALGSSSLNGASTGNYNTAVGSAALNSNNSFDNTAVGYAAGASMTGHDNVAVGDSAGLNDKIGKYNIYMGSPSGRANKSLSNQVYIGDSTGPSVPIAIKFSGSLEPYYSSNYQPGTSGQPLLSQGANTSPQYATLGTTYGGTGISTASSTGVAQVSSGTWSVSTALASGTTATTQSVGDNSTKVATTAYVDAQGGTQVNQALQYLGSGVLYQTLGVNPAMMTTSGTPTSGTIFWVPIWIPKATTITGVKWYQNQKGNYTANNYNGVGLYTYSGGTYTLVDSCANNGNIWQTANGGTVGSQAFASTYPAAGNQLVFVALVYSESAKTTDPIIAEATAISGSGVSSLDFTNSAKLFGTQATQTTMPATRAGSALTAGTVVFWIALY